ncbi:hypothetical protein RRG08_064492 [Elysia crispata]|uniref:Uncharacterized protein n=1 Tax=Elysia crispata TaxID=231223 RepID=A0AAE1AE99_9GAST|nr:hypothetical protein RRG08_064492 [Elysia crispata]
MPLRLTQQENQNSLGEEQVSIQQVPIWPSNTARDSKRRKLSEVKQIKTVLNRNRACAKKYDWCHSAQTARSSLMYRVKARPTLKHERPC